MKKTFTYFYNKLFPFVGVLALLSVIVVVVSYFTIRSGSEKYIYSDTSSLSHAQAVMILGASTLSNGDLSLILKQRVDTAISIYRKGIVDKILVTGDNGTLSYNEVDPVRVYLLKNNIPEKDIFLDHAGFDTYSSMYRARDVFLIESIVVVSQSFHLPRAVYIARHLGLSAVGVSADNCSYLWRNYVREVFADVKALVDVYLNRQPKYLGPVIPITGNSGNNI